MKKHFSLKRLLIMSLMLVTTMLVPICAWAQEYPETHKIRYTASERLSDYGEGNGTPCGKVVSHEFSDGKGCITFTEPVTSIGDDAFYWCENLTSIILPEGLTSIGDHAFFFCGSLTSIIIPEGLTSIGEHAFHYCENLTSITLPEGLTSIGYDAFSECSSLISIILPLSLTSIGDFAFHNCSSLASITLPEGVTSIGFEAFAGCNNLVYCNILSSQIENDQVSSIPDDAYLIVPADRKDDYQNLYGNDRVFCNDRVITYTTSNGEGLYINREEFSGEFDNVNCDNYGMILFDGPVTSIGDGAFNGCENLTSIILPEGVTSIGDDAFFECYNLTSITIPEGVTSIGDWAFTLCGSLTSITIPEGVSSIGVGAFQSCRSLASITLPASVTSIGDVAFSSCENLTSITIPASVTSMGDEVFHWCGNLQSVIFSGFNGEGNDLVLKYDSNKDTYSAEALTIDDSKPLQIPVDFTAESVAYSREVTAGKPCTFMLPYAVTGEQLGGTIYKLSGYEDDKVKFAQVEGETKPNVPYMIVPTGNALQGSVTNDNVQIQKTAGKAFVSGSFAGLQMVGSYSKQQLTVSPGLDFYGFYQGSFVKAGVSANLNPYRAMLQLAGTSGSAPSRLSMILDEEATSVTTLDEEMDKSTLPLYDLYGRQISAPSTRGIYINPQSGKKMFFSE